MPVTILTIKEYDTLCLPPECVCHIDKFQNYLLQNNLSQALKITGNKIKAKSCVGVIKYKNIQIQILPKLISQNKENTAILKNLFFMLSYTKKMTIKTTNDAKLTQAENPFLEILINEYATTLIEALKRSIPRNYIQKQENLNLIKGKLMFAQNLKYNLANEAKAYCQYDDFSENNTLNQFFLFISTMLLNLTKSASNKKTLKQIINIYANIDFRRFTKFDLKNIRLTRSEEIFTRPFNLAKMFLENASTDITHNKFNNIALVWDMNKLFEEFIFRVLKRYCPNKNITYQKAKKMLKNQETNQEIGKTNVDIFITLPDKNIVIDTKYKKITSPDSCENNDINQIYTYCRLHNAQEGILLYPQWEDHKIAAPNLKLNDPGEKITLKVKTVNLQTDDLKNNINALAQELISFIF